MVRNTLKLENLDVCPLSVENEAFLKSNLTSRSSFNLFKDVFERSWRQLQLIARKKDFISMYRGAPVNGFANILVYFNKEANNFETIR